MKSAKKLSTLRIIGGKWRSRRFSFLNLPGVRPTPNRIRETLFNWLQNHIEDAHCLDLFTGSGALGLEALSRGAASVTFVDESPRILEHIEKQLKVFSADNAHLLRAKIPKDLSKPSQKFNVIFLDPPFRENLLPTTAEKLEKLDMLNHDSYIYIEAEANLVLDLPLNWEIIKRRKSGQVAYYLAHRK